MDEKLKQYTILTFVCVCFVEMKNLNSSIYINELITNNKLEL